MYTGCTNKFYLANLWSLPDRPELEGTKIKRNYYQTKPLEPTTGSLPDWPEPEVTKTKRKITKPCFYNQLPVDFRAEANCLKLVGTPCKYGNQQ